MKRVLHYTVLTALFAIVSGCAAFAQGQVFLNDGSMATIERSSAISPDVASVCSGVVVDEAGNPVDGVNIVACRDLLFPDVFGTQGKKGGRFGLRVIKGNYCIEFTAPGYENLRMEVDLMRDADMGEVVMRRSGEEGASGAGVAFKMMRSYYVMNLKPSSYEGGTLADILADAPFVDLFGGQGSVMLNENYELTIDGQPVRVEAGVLRNYLASIAGGEVKSVKVVTGRRKPIADAYPATPAVVSVTTR